MVRIVSILIIITMGLMNTGFGEDLTAREIMEKNDEQQTSHDEQSTFKMRLINKRGKERKREVLLYSKTDEHNNELTLIRFQAPADVKGVGLLSIEENNREDQWLYLPALKRIRRISSSEKTDSFMGSDFSYEDVEQNELEDYQYTLLREEDMDGFACYVIQSIPGNDQVKEETAYSKTEAWVRQDHFVTVKANFFDKKGELVKVMTSKDFLQVSNTKKLRPSIVEMSNVKTGHRTVLQYGERRLNEGVDDKFFTQRYLERGR